MTMTETPTIEFEFDILTTSDRCDACNAQAFTQVAVPRTPRRKNKNYVELKFCGHHFTKHELLLVANGYLIKDSRDQIHP